MFRPVLRKTRAIWVKATLLESQFSVMKCGVLRLQHL